MPIQTKPESSQHGIPVVPISIATLVQQLQAAYQTTTAGKFTEAVTSFKNILYWSIFVVTSSKAEMNEVSFFFSSFFFSFSFFSFSFFLLLLFLLLFLFQ